MDTDNNCRGPQLPKGLDILLKLNWKMDIVEFKFSSYFYAGLMSIYFVILNTLIWIFNTRHLREVEKPNKCGVLIWAEGVGKIFKNWLAGGTAISHLRVRFLRLLIFIGLPLYHMLLYLKYSVVCRFTKKVLNAVDNRTETNIWTKKIRIQTLVWNEQSK